MSNHKTIFQQLIDPSNLPVYFDPDPRLVQGISLNYTGSSATVTVEAGVLTTAVNGGAGTPISLNLNQYTLSSLVAIINASPGYTATLIGAGSTSALAITEVYQVNITSTVPLNVFTNIVWQLFTVIARQMNIILNQIDSALNEQYLSFANGKWADFWGLLYGKQTRLNNELDKDYTNRIINTITNSSPSARDIANTVAQTLGLQISIMDHQNDVVKYIGQSYVGQNLVSDRAHAKNQFVVIGAGNNQPVINFISSSKAAGVRPIYNYSTPNLNASIAMNGMPILFPISPIVS